MKKRIIICIISILSIIGCLLLFFFLPNKKEIEKEKPMKNETKKEINISKEKAKEYGNTGEKYTTLNDFTFDTYIKVSEESKHIYNEVGISNITISKYVTAFVSAKDIKADEITLLDYCYAESLDGNPMKHVFGKLNDKNQTLITIIYQPKTATTSAYIDCIPCQYSLEEIQNKVWLEKEVQ